MQEAKLDKVQLQGIVNGEWLSSVSFEDRIRRQAGKETDLHFSKVIFSGGLSQEDVNSLVKDLSDEVASKLRGKLTSHIDQPVRNQLPQDSEATTDTGSYTEEEAEQWIAEYKKAMSEVPEDDS